MKKTYPVFISIFIFINVFVSKPKETSGGGQKSNKITTPDCDYMTDLIKAASLPFGIYSFITK